MVMTSHMEYGPIESCQACQADTLQSVLFLGYLPPVNSMRQIGTAAHEEAWYPAELLVCPMCHLTQLGFAVEPEILFPPDYPYTSGTTRVLRDNFADLYAEVQARIGLGPGDLVVDVGSNDGTLLSNFAIAGHPVVGIEPSLKAELAVERGIPTRMSFFDSAAVQGILDDYGQPRVVTATNVFAHIHNVHAVLHNLKQLVGDSGVFISESHYLPGLVDSLQYDTIYHEHLRYYSLTSLNNLLVQHGFRIFHVRRIPTHGGSLRVYASLSSEYSVTPQVGELLKVEADAGFASNAWVAGFRERVIVSKRQLVSLLARLKSEGAHIYGIGAPSRASTLVNYVGLDDGVLDYVLEINGSHKLGKYMPGRNIPVVDETRLYDDQPAYVLLLSWHIADEVCRNLKRRGYTGDFIVPLPKPYVIDNAQVELG